jgi:hypothetical protein
LKPRDAGELIELAELCRVYKKLYRLAVHFYADAFALEPKFADDRHAAYRYDAACAAAKGGCGLGKDAADLDAAARTRLREQALVWLRAELVAWKQQLGNGNSSEAARVQKKLGDWPHDRDLAGVRGDALAKLPQEERQRWHQLWSDFERTLARAQPAGPRVVLEEKK